jgi:hypothetical protein
MSKYLTKNFFFKVLALAWRIGLRRRVVAPRREGLGLVREALRDRVGGATMGIETKRAIARCSAHNFWKWLDDVICQGISWTSSRFGGDRACGCVDMLKIMFQVGQFWKMGLHHTE